MADLEGVSLLDVEDVRRFAETQMSTRRGEIPAVRAILIEELERYRSSSAARSAAPVVAALRTRAESIRRAELDRQRERIDALGPEARKIVETVTQRTVAKLLHEPTVRIKDAAGSPAAKGSPRRFAACSTSRGDVLTLRVATRGSPLALRQAELVARAIAAAAGSGGVAAELVVVETSGDLHRDRPIGAIGGQGVFVGEVERALVEGRADLAVHSAKDLPSAAGWGELEIVAVPKRADPRDALVGRALADLGPGAHVATGAPRRRAQLAWVRPDLRFEELRGNIDTRARQGARGRRRRRRSTPPSSVSASPGASPRCSRPRRCCPRWAKVPWRSRPGRATR